MPTSTENTNDKSINWKGLLTTAINTYRSSKTIRATFCHFIGAETHAHAHQNTCNIILNELNHDSSDKNAAVLFFALLKYLTVHRNSTDLSNLLFKQYQSATSESKTKMLKDCLCEMKIETSPQTSPREQKTNNSNQSSSYDSFTDINYTQIINELLPKEDKLENLNKCINPILDKLIKNSPVQKPAIASPVQKQVTAQSQSTSVDSYESFVF